MKNKMFSLPITKINFSYNSEQNDLRKVRLQVCKSGLVPSHNLIIEEEALICSEDSIKNKPILCAYEVDDEGNKTDFQGHEMEYKLVKEGNTIQLKVEYIEQPVGVIPESCNFSIEEIDNEKWVVVDGYIYNEYCSDAVRLIEENDGQKSVSMEINVLESEYDEVEEATRIKKFAFLGITILGLEHPPAISGANIKTFSQSDTFALKFTELIERINKNIKKGGEMVKRNEIIEKFSALKGNEEFEKIVSDLNLSDEDLEKKLFSLSVNDLESRLREKLNELICTHTDYWGDTYEVRKYWLRDVLFSENIVIVEDNECYYRHYGIPYEISGDEIIIKEDERKRYIRGDWRPFEDGENEPEINSVFSEIDNHNKTKVEEIKAEFEKINKELDDTKSKFTDLQTIKTELDKEVLELREFKSDFEKNQKEEKINEVLNKFEELKEIEGYDKIYECRFEIPIETLETKLKVLAFDNNVVINKKQCKKSFSKSSSGVRIPVNDIDNSVDNDGYGGLLDKYLNK